MRTPTSNGSIDRHHTFAKRWMITATAIYGLMLIGLLAVVTTGSGSDDKFEGGTSSYTAMISRRRLPTRPAVEPKADTIRPKPPMAINKAAEPATSVKTARPASVPVPEVDEMAEAFPERARPPSQAGPRPPHKDRTRWSRMAGTSTRRTAFPVSARCRSPATRRPLTGAGWHERSDNVIGERFAAHLMLQPPAPRSRDGIAYRAAGCLNTKSLSIRPCGGFDDAENLPGRIVLFRLHRADGSA